MPLHDRLRTIALSLLVATPLLAAVSPGAAQAATLAPMAGQAATPLPSRPTVTAGPTTTAQAAFIKAMAPGAQASQRIHGVPASVTIAQAILESAWGTSLLTANHKNFFGIKCSADNKPYATGCAPYLTTECVGDACMPTRARFRVYPSVAASLADHGRFLRVNARYAPAFRAGSADAFIRAVHKAGYATDPRYADSVIRVMNQYGLRAYDRT